VNRAVLVTGASTGIGEATAQRMARAGWDVFAGARKDEDLARLREAGLQAVRLDVTDPESIAAAKAELDERGLRGLVNNAGVAISAPIEFVPLDELRRQLEINLVGQVAVIQAFLPNIRDGKGRIVNVSSIGGKIALPLVGPYAASKFGLEAVSDSLRRELRPWGIHVSVIEPGAVVTPIWDKGRATADELEAAMGEQGRKLYGRLADRIREETEKIPDRGVSPDEVAKAIEAALTASRPKTRYVVGRDAKVRLKIKALVGDRRFDALIARTLDWK
jgi:NAD(P)-dependent dehydrogenase (short-subunit alcohol dehydrogenase family)